MNKLSKTQLDVLRKMSEGWKLWRGQNTRLRKGVGFICVRASTLKALHDRHFIKVREFGIPEKLALTDKGRRAISQ